MGMPRRTAVTVLTTVALAGAGLLGLTACAEDGPASNAAAVADDFTDVLNMTDALGVEEQALTALGFAPTELTAAGPAAVEAAPASSPGAASASPGSVGGDTSDNRRGERRRPLKRELLRSRVLHAEAVVQTKDGVATVLSQHGTITAITDRTMTVKSADGFTLTWTFGKDLRVLERRRTVQPSDLTVGAEVGVAGAKQGDAGVARLIVRRDKK